MLLAGMHLRHIRFRSGNKLEEVELQFTMTTDYAIRCLLYLSQNKGVCASQKIRAYAKISSDEHTRKILRQLKYGGLVRSDKGAFGGYSLTKPVDKITVLDVLRCTEDTVKINRFLESPDNTSSYTGELSPVFHFYEKTQALLESYFDSITLSDILNGKIPEMRQ